MIVTVDDVLQLDNCPRNESSKEVVPAFTGSTHHKLYQKVYTIQFRNQKILIGLSHVNQNRYYKTLYLEPIYSLLHKNFVICY